MPAAAGQKNKRKQGNIIVPGNLFFTVRAKRSPAEKWYPSRQAINNYVQKTAYAQSQNKNQKTHTSSPYGKQIQFWLSPDAPIKLLQEPQASVGKSADSAKHLLSASWEKDLDWGLKQT